MEASFTPQLSYGYYSPYIASVLDIARILDSFHTAQYQYIPALASQQGNGLMLSLNTPPSFNNPEVGAGRGAARHRAAAVAAAACGGSRRNLLRAQVAAGAGGRWARRWCSPPLCARHDAERRRQGRQARRAAGATPTRSAAASWSIPRRWRAAALADGVRGSLHGYWGFEKYEGPSFRLVGAHAATMAN